MSTGTVEAATGSGKPLLIQLSLELDQREFKVTPAMESEAKTR